MNILTTVFLRYDNQKIIYPNSVLATKPISNYYRSPDMGDAIEFCIHISTPVEKIAIMKQRITRYILKSYLLSPLSFSLFYLLLPDIKGAVRVLGSEHIIHSEEYI